MRCLLMLLFGTISAQAADYQPDPRTVQRFGPAYRYPQAGWIVLHIEGEPYERGVQHGRLLAPEIAAHIRGLAAYNGHKSPKEAWKMIRNSANSLFLRRYAKEYLEEMKGIAEGASAAGARFEDRPIDLIDIVAINSSNELDSLEGALEATPTGMEGLRLTAENAKSAPIVVARAARRARPLRCNAFAATGPATRDGKLVFGHITMYDLYPANFYNIWIDVKPSKGHRFIMQSYPGGMHSGMDYSINAAGILMSETTLEQTGFDIQGTPLASRIRESIQYADNIDKAVEILRKDNNGLSTNEWILADLKNNEIALFTLGTHKSKLLRSSRDEWVGGTKGFYWSCNNSKELEVRLESAPGVLGRPSPAAVFVPSKRDVVWQRLYEKHKGQIDADFARQALTLPTLVAHSSVDAKYTTAELAGQLKSWATFGPPIGKTWHPTFTERREFPEIRPLVSNPWTLLHTIAPEKGRAPAVPVVDLHDPDESELSAPPKKVPDLVTTPAWRGTLLPKSDADIWLSTSFANYERIVAESKALRKQAKDDESASAELDHTGVGLFYYRSLYELGARAAEDMPLAKIRPTMLDDNWHKIASGKGVLLLHSLRGLLGAQDFDRLMDEFGRQNAGKAVSTAQFQAHLEKETAKSLETFFEPWLNKTGLPRLELGKFESAGSGKRWTSSGTIAKNGPSLMVPVTIETAKKELTHPLRLEKESDVVSLKTDAKPVRMIVDKYGLVARGNGGPFTILSFCNDLERCLIVYGTLDENSTNREAAAALQGALRRREHNVTVSVKKDIEATTADLTSNHVLLIGRPDSNSIVARFRDKLPLTFGPRSFEVRGEAFAHPESIVLAAAENPLNRRYSIVVIAGLSGSATLRASPLFENDTLSYGEVVVLAHNQEERAMVVPPKELIREFPKR